MTIKDHYFDEMGIPLEKRCYVKCRYCDAGLDYCVSVNDKNKGFAFVDGGLIKNVKKNSKKEFKGLVRAMLVEKIGDIYHVFINGEGFGIPKKDVVLD